VLDDVSPQRRAAVATLRTSTVWERRGNLEAAIAGYKRALALDARFVEPYRRLANVMLKLGEAREALRYFDHVLALDPDDVDISMYRDRLAAVIVQPGDYDPSLASRPAKVSRTTRSPVTAPPGAINLSGQKTFSFQRSGWGYALGALTPLHHDAGIYFDGFIERHFAWQHKIALRPAHVLLKMKLEGTFDTLATSEERGIVPYRGPWIGVVHNPHNMPHWFHFDESPQAIFAKDIWKRSLDTCVGLFTLSEHTARWLREQTGKPVSALVHPTEAPPVGFDFERFLQNPHKSILQIGWWLRKLTAIYQLPIGVDNAMGYRKVRLVPQFIPTASAHLNRLMEKERQVLGLTVDRRWADNTREEDQVSNAEYDRLLSENIVFIELHDANANNVVIECIARATPLLINPLPAVIEYLGRDYPLYYSSLEEARSKALDPDLLYRGHRYLLTCDTRTKLSADHLLEQFRASEVYRRVLTPKGWSVGDPRQ
jgi:tetratricopeptide (TPR) repeat protein